MSTEDKTGLMNGFTFITVNETVSPRTSAAETRENKHEFKVAQQQSLTTYSCF